MPGETSTIRIAEELGPASVPFSEALGGAAALNGLWLGQAGPLRLEVLELTSAAEPTVQSLRAAWHKRRARRAVPLIVFWQGEHDVLMTEPVGDPASVAITNVTRTAALAILQRALKTPQREVVSLVLSLLERTQGSAGIAGFRNRNLLSTHYMTTSYQRDHKAEWTRLSEVGAAARNEQGAKLLRALGYAPTSRPFAFEVVAGKAVRVQALVLPEGAAFDRSPAGPGDAPATRLLTEARAKGAKAAVIAAGRLVRIYLADVAQGLDDVTTASTYIELDLDILADEWSGLLPLIFSADSHQPGGLFERLVQESSRYAVALRSRFRDRIYNTIVEGVASSLFDARGRRKVDVEVLYQATLRLLYRLLFVLYAEDRNLLPLGNPEYRRKSLTQTLFRLEEYRRSGKPFDPRQTTLWDDLFSIFDAIRGGSVEWNIPAYNGGLFEPALPDHPEAAFLHAVKIPNAKLAPLLLSIAFDEEDGSRGKIDFGDLGVRHLGTLYEGLLSYSIRVADVDLTTDRDGLYVPAKAKDTPIVSAGDVYVTSPKGGRKASGSHYTPTFVVRRLLENALEPVLENHLRDISTKVPEEQWDAMLAFSVVDPAMGSGHFLVDALDVITNRFVTFLSDNPRITATPIKAAREQITAIGKTFGIEALGASISDFELLRRVVMRNCIYGVDLNPMAVELAKLSLWLHAFVPGLPLSFLGHNLRHGNALVGVVGPEIADKIGDNLFGGAVSAALADAVEQANRLSSLSDLSYEEVKRSESAQDALEAATVPISSAFDAYCCRVFARNNELALRADRERGRASLEHHDGLAQVLEGRTEGEEKRQIAKAQTVARTLGAFHWQLAFPEVFLRDKPGFNVVLGNPPWDKVRFEAQQFWVSRVPGLNALPAGEREDRIAEIRQSRVHEAEEENRERARRELLQDVILSEYQIQGRVGHVELAKAFTERVLSLKAAMGAIGYVLPGNALIIGGWAKIREAIADYDLSIIEARNTGGWMFQDAEHRMSVVILSASPRTQLGKTVVVPEVASFRDLESSNRRPAIVLSRDEIASLSDSSIIPWLNRSDEVSVLDKMRRRPALSSGSGWVKGQHEAKWDFRSTGPDHRFARSATSRADAWKILMTRHVDQYQLAYAVPFQQEVRDATALVNTHKNIVLKRGKPLLGSGHSRIVIRHPSRSDDSRTMIGAFLPDLGYLPCKGYVHSVQTEGGTPNKSLALLGYLNSFACDWWVRRFVDRHVTAPVVNRLPLPDWSEREIDAVSEDVRIALSADDLVRKSLGSGDFTERQREEARLRIEIAVIRGFGLEPDEVRTILADFSDTDRVAPQSVRTALRTHSGAGAQAGVA